jgi:hypothetical protein
VDENLKKKKQRKEKRKQKQNKKSTRKSWLSFQKLERFKPVFV